MQINRPSIGTTGAPPAPDCELPRIFPERRVFIERRLNFAMCLFGTPDDFTRWLGSDVLAASRAGVGSVRHRSELQSRSGRSTASPSRRPMNASRRTNQKMPGRFPWSLTASTLHFSMRLFRSRPTETARIYLLSKELAKLGDSPDVPFDSGEAALPGRDQIAPTLPVHRRLLHALVILEFSPAPGSGFGRRYSPRDRRNPA